MVCGVEARTLEDDPGGGDDLFQCLPAALGTGLQWFVGERLMAFKLDTTIFTTISIDWHSFSPCISFGNNTEIIARLMERGKPWTWHVIIF